MYLLRTEAKQWEPIAGVPWHDLTDEEYEAVSTAYDAQFPDQPGSLLRWFDHVPDWAAGPIEEGDTNDDA